MTNEVRCCEDCKEPSFNWSWGGMVILPLKLWEKIGTATTLLCDKCIEGRLARPLSFKDFPNRRVVVYENQGFLNSRKIPCNVEYFTLRGWIGKS